MDFRQNTMDEIIESEHQMLLNARNRYGDYFQNALSFNGLLQEFVKSVDPDRYIFAMFLAQIRKHHTLALFSAIRLHHIQTMMDLRQVLEAVSCAAFAIANPDKDGFAGIDKNGLIDTPKDLTVKRYKWLEENFKKGSDNIKGMKEIINRATAHSNIVYAHNNFNFDGKGKRFETPFFDFEDEYQVKGDLWQIANIALGAVDLFYGVNRGRDVVKFISDFGTRLKLLEAENHKLKAELMTTDRYKKSTAKNVEIELEPSKRNTAKS